MGPGRNRAPRIIRLPVVFQSCGDGLSFDLVTVTIVTDTGIVIGKVGAVNRKGQAFKLVTKCGKVIADRSIKQRIGLVLAGVGIVVKSVVDVNETLGTSKPLLVKSISNAAELSGNAPVVCIPTFCAYPKTLIDTILMVKIIFFMNLFL